MAFKKIGISVILALLWTSLLAQKNVTVGIYSELAIPMPPKDLAKTQGIDTLEQYVLRADTARLYQSNDGGYVFGTGYFDDNGVNIRVTEATGNHYDPVPNAWVTEVLVWVGKLSIVGDPDTVYARIYSIDGDSSPVALLGEGKILSSQLSPNVLFEYSSIPLTQPVSTQGNPFIVALEYPNMDDTLGIVSSNFSTQNGNNEDRCRQLGLAPFLAQWERARFFWNPQLDCDPFIVPVVADSLSISVDPAVKSGGLELLGNYPNPARDLTRIRFNLDRSKELNLRVFDVAGRTLFETGKVMYAPGNHEIPVILDGAAAGAWYYTLSGEEVQLTSKILGMQ